MSASIAGEFLLETFEQQPALPGAIVMADERTLLGVISRQRFFEYLSRPYGKRLFLRYPLAVLWRTVAVSGQAPLQLPVSCSIQRAVEAMLRRPRHLVYEPIVVELGQGQYRLLDPQVVLLAQARLLSVAHQVIKTQDSRLQRQQHDRYRVEVDLQQVEEKYRSFFENSMEGIYQMSPDGRYLSVNPALARLYGYASPGALIQQHGCTAQQLYVQPTYWVELMDYLDRYGAIADVEAEVYRQDGSVIWISQCVRVVKDEQGRVRHYEGIVRDITQSRCLEEELRRQRQRAERLLLNVLPQPIAERLQKDQHPIADHFANVTVLFADIVGFTKLAVCMPPTELVDLLNRIFSRFDQLTEQFGLEKIKTIGDEYMVAAGLPMPRADHAEAIAAMALSMQAEMAHFRTERGKRFQIRIGMDTGPVVAGVIGIKRFIYDLWGDTVNVASRMESQGCPGQIQVTSAVYERLKDSYQFRRRGVIAVKGRGKMTTYWLLGQKDRSLQSSDGKSKSTVVM